MHPRQDSVSPPHRRKYRLLTDVNRDAHMPLDLCHPTVAHEKLKLPEWYVSSLMMDRALNAICRRYLRAFVGNK